MKRFLEIGLEEVEEPKTEKVSKSYDKIDYSIRPSKCIERKMLCEAFGRLFPFGEVKKYRYIGFGSPFFIDFQLFHKNLAIQNMICLEIHKEDKKRFEFNKPYSCVEILYGDSNDILPTLDWDIGTIIWLDYDTTLNTSILEDIRHVLTSATTGSVIVVTVDGSVRDKENEKIKGEGSLKQLIKNVGKSKVPREIKERDLHGWKTSEIFRKIIDNEISTIIKHRNGGKSIGSGIIYKQLFNFHYKDTSRMLTVGGIIFDEGTKSKFKDCKFKELEFIRSSHKTYLILTPKITLREIKLLDKYLPDNFRSCPKSIVPKGHKETYRNVYRYFPHFKETDL